MAVDFFTLVTNADALLTVLGSLDTTVAYAILFAVYSLETGVAPVSFLPGNSPLFLCGTLTMTAVFAFGTLFAVLSVAAFVGNLLSYETGAFLGAQLYARRIRWIDPERLEMRTTSTSDTAGKPSLLRVLRLSFVLSCRS